MAEIDRPSDTPRTVLALLGDRRVRVLLAVAAAVRAVIFFHLWVRDPLARVLISDPAYYDRWARTLAEGGEFLPGQAAWLPPLYPWLLSVGYRLTGGALGATWLVQGIVGLGVLLGVIALAERVAGRRAGLAAGWLWTLYLPVVFFETRLLSVNVALPLSVGALLYFSRAEAELRGGGAARLAAALGGLALGLAALARPNLLLAAPAVALALLVRAKGARGMGAAVALVGGAAFGVLPGLVHNWSESGRPVLVTANGGVNFWFGNNHEARGTFHAPGPEWGSIETQRDVSIQLASKGAGRELTETEASRHWFGEGIGWIGFHPGAALKLWGRKLGDTLSSTEFGIQYVPAAHRAVAPSLWLGVLPFGALLFLAAVGAPGAARGRASLVAWLLAGLAASLLYFTYSRFRLPLLPALLPFAGRGLVRVLDALRGGTRPAPAAILAGALLWAVSYVPFEGAYPTQLESNAYVDMGLATDDLARSEGFFERAVELVPGNVEAHYELARLAKDRGDLRGSLEVMRHARGFGVTYGPLEYAYAGLLVTSPDPNLLDVVHGVEVIRRYLDRHPPEDPYADEFALTLAEVIGKYPEFERIPREARHLVEGVLLRQPNHPRARAIWRDLEGL